MRVADVWHGKDGYILKVHDVPAWAYAADAVINAVTGAVCGLSRGWACPLCLCNKAEWTFRAGWGWDAEWEMRKHSLGGFLFGLGQRGGNFCHRRGREVYERLLTFDEVCEHFPDKRTEWDDDGIDCVKGVPVSARIQEEHGDFGVVS